MVPALVIELGRAEGVAVLLVRTLWLQTAWNGMRESSGLGRQRMNVVWCVWSLTCLKGAHFSPLLCSGG